MGNNFTQTHSFNTSGDRNDWIIEENQCWMAGLNDESRLVRLSIPGTHNSAAEFDGDIGNRPYACQSKCITHQLDIGIRFFDIRCSKFRDHDAFGIFHGPYYFNKTLDDILQDIDTFLTNNPSEFVLIRLKLNEHDVPLLSHLSHNGTEDENARIFKSLLLKHPRLFLKTQRKSLANIIVRNLRGKILLFQSQQLGDFYWWNDPNLLIEDECDKYGGDKKRSIIHGFQNFTKENKLSITFVSSSYQPLLHPIQESAQDNNRAADDIIWEYSGVGVVVFDFPGDELICSVIEKNFMTSLECEGFRKFDLADTFTLDGCVNIRAYTEQPLAIKGKFAFLCVYDGELCRCKSELPDEDCSFELVRVDGDDVNKFALRSTATGQFVSLGKHGKALRNHARADEQFFMFEDNGSFSIRTAQYQRYLSIGSECVAVRDHCARDEKFAIYFFP